MPDIDPPPRDFAALKALITERAADLPKRLTQIASFALDNPTRSPLARCRRLPSKPMCSPRPWCASARPSAIRASPTCRRCSARACVTSILNYGERIQQLREHALEASKPNVIFQGFCNSTEKSIASLREKLDPDELDQAVATLAQAQPFYLIGLRRSFPIASYMAYAFGKLGVRSILVDAVGGMAAEQLTFASPADAVLAISFTPYASETVALTQGAVARGVPVVSITDSPFSPLAQVSGQWIEVSEANFEGFRSMAATLTLAMTLTVAIAEKRGAG